MTSGHETTDTLSTPGLDNTRLFISFTAGAGTRCMSLLSSSPSLETYLEMKEETTTTASNRPAFSSARAEDGKGGQAGSRLSLLSSSLRPLMD